MRKAVLRGISDVLLIVITFVSLLPFLYMFLMSFKSTQNAYNIDFDLSEFTIIQYQKVFAVDHFIRYIFNSVFVAVAGVVLALTVCSLAAYAFAKLDFKGRDSWFASLVMTMVVPSATLLVPLFLVAKYLGLLNTYAALILPLPTAFGVFILRQAILGIPQELIDAAKMDGCSDLRIFFTVVLPLIKSSLMALAIFTFVGAWNNYVWPLIACIDPEMKTLPLALDMMKTQYSTDVGLTMACAVINFLPPFIFYVCMQSQFKEGLTLSGMKG